MHTDIEHVSYSMYLYRALVWYFTTDRRARKMLRKCSQIFNEPHQRLLFIRWDHNRPDNNLRVDVVDAVQTTCSRIIRSRVGYLIM